MRAIICLFLFLFYGSVAATGEPTPLPMRVEYRETTGAMLARATLVVQQRFDKRFVAQPGQVEPSLLAGPDAMAWLPRDTLRKEDELHLRTLLRSPESIAILIKDVRRDEDGQTTHLLLIPKPTRTSPELPPSGVFKYADILALDLDRLEGNDPNNCPGYFVMEGERGAGCSCYAVQFPCCGDQCPIGNQNACTHTCNVGATDVERLRDVLGRYDERFVNPLPIQYLLPLGAMSPLNLGGIGK